MAGGPLERRAVRSARIALDGSMRQQREMPMVPRVKPGGQDGILVRVDPDGKATTLAKRSWNRQHACVGVPIGRRFLFRRHARKRGLGL